MGATEGVAGFAGGVGCGFALLAPFSSALLFKTGVADETGVSILLGGFSPTGNSVEGFDGGWGVCDPGGPGGPGGRWKGICRGGGPIGMGAGVGNWLGP